MNPVLERWDLKLRNWALWYVGRTAQSGGSACDDYHGEGAPRPPPPLVGAALDTDALVRRLSMEHFDAVKAYYVWTGTIEENAADIGIHPDTLMDRVMAAKFRLDDMARERDRARTKPPTVSTV